MTKQGIGVLITALRCPQKRTVSAITEKFHIPHLAVDPSPCSSRTQGGFTLDLPRPQENLVTVLIDLIHSVAWKRIHLEFNRGFGRVEFQLLAFYIIYGYLEFPINSVLVSVPKDKLSL